jgi:hypothetical protein
LGDGQREHAVERAQERRIAVFALDVVATALAQGSS